ATKKLRGCGSKVSTSTLAPDGCASSPARASSAWWPRCTPSKFPSGTTAPRHGAGTAAKSSNRAGRVMIVACSLPGSFRAVEDQDRRLAVQHHLVADGADRVELHPALLRHDLAHSRARGDAIADTHGRLEV